MGVRLRYYWQNMRVTFITTKINFEKAGGSVPEMDLRIRDMQSMGADVLVVTVFSEKNELPDNLPYKVVEEFSLNKALPALQSNIVRILEKYEKETDVFHIEGQFAYAGGWYRLWGGKPILAYFNRELLVWERGGLKRALRREIERFFCSFIVPYIDVCTFTSPQFLAAYRSFGLRMPDARARVMMDFFDAEAIRKEAHQKELRTDKRLTLFASGRMVRDKGFHLLVDAIGLLPQNVREKLFITVGGDGPERKTLMQTAKERALPIDFPGWLSKNDLWKHLSTADILVLPRWHFFLPSFLVYESLSLGIPTIAPGGGGVAWMAGDAIEPFDFDNAASLSRAIETLVQDEKKRENLRAKALKRAKETDHIETRKQLFEALSSLNPSQNKPQGYAMN